MEAGRKEVKRWEEEAGRGEVGFIEGRGPGLHHPAI